MQNSKILITYFESFNDRKINISKEVVTKIGKEYDIVEVPVSFARSFQKIENIIKEYDYVILTGEAITRKEVTIEYVALNLKHANIKDNDGKVIINEKIGNKEAYISNVDIIKLTETTEAKLSLSAGSFVCNYLYYKTLEKINNEKLDTKCVFIHFPNVNICNDINNNPKLYNIENVTKIFTNILNNL